MDARFFEPNLGALAERFRVYTPERRGHGHTPDVPGPITYQLMADDTIAFLEGVVGKPADLVGHSDGAFVALCLVAMQRPELVKRLVMISGGFSKEGEAAPDEEWNVRRDRGVPRARLRRGAPRTARSTSGGGDQDRRDGPPANQYLEASELAKATARSLVMFADDDLSSDDDALVRSRSSPTFCRPGPTPRGASARARLPQTNEPVPTVAPMRRSRLPG